MISGICYSNKKLTNTVIHSFLQKHTGYVHVPDMKLSDKYSREKKGNIWFLSSWSAHSTEAN